LTRRRRGTSVRILILLIMYDNLVVVCAGWIWFEKWRIGLRIGFAITHQKSVMTRNHINNGEGWFEAMGFLTFFVSSIVDRFRVPVAKSPGSSFNIQSGGSQSTLKYQPFLFIGLLLLFDIGRFQIVLFFLLFVPDMFSAFAVG
jgi:hypothetical protein